MYLYILHVCIYIYVYIYYICPQVTYLYVQSCVYLYILGHGSTWGPDVSIYMYIHVCDDVTSARQPASNIQKSKSPKTKNPRIPKSPKTKIPQNKDSYDTCALTPNRVLSNLFV